jgi:hypothetical protein
MKYTPFSNNIDTAKRVCNVGKFILLALCATCIAVIYCCNGWSNIPRHDKAVFIIIIPLLLFVAGKMILSAYRDIKYYQGDNDRNSQQCNNCNTFKTGTICLLIALAVAVGYIAFKLENKEKFPTINTTSVEK